MVIKEKKQLSFVIQADRMMNRGTFKRTLFDRIRELVFPDHIMSFLYYMRKCSYYRHGGGGMLSRIMYAYNMKLYCRLGEKLGFSIGCDSLGYGVVIPHYGTIVIGSSPRIGNYAVLHTSTCISNNKKIIGDGLYLSTGAIITSEITLGNYISIGANSVVNKSYTGNNALIAGAPAKYIKDKEPWYDGKYLWRMEQVEILKQQMNIQ